MRTPEQLSKDQQEMRARVAGRKVKKPPSKSEAERKIRKRRRNQKKAYHAQVKAEKKLQREAAAKLRAEKLAAKAVRRAIWLEKKAEREAKKAERTNPVKKLSKRDQAFIEGFEAGKRFALEGIQPNQHPITLSETTPASA
jgi:hypothetical protein